MVGFVFPHHAICRGCTSTMPWLFHCTLLSHIFRHRTIVWQFESWILCCLLALLSLWYIWGYLSRVVGPVCSRTVIFVWLTYFYFSEGAIVHSGSTSLKWWCVLSDWAFQWWIPSFLYLFLLKLVMLWCFVLMLYIFLLLGTPIESGSGCPNPEKSCVRESCLLLWVYIVRGVIYQ